MIRKLNADELAARPDYVLFLKNLSVGEGGMGSTIEEGLGKITLKNHLNMAAAAARMKIKFHRSGEKSVVFEVIGRD